MIMKENSCSRRKGRGRRLRESLHAGAVNLDAGRQNGVTTAWTRRARRVKGRRLEEEEEEEEECGNEVPCRGRGPCFAAGRQNGRRQLGFQLFRCSLPDTL